MRNFFCFLPIIVIEGKINKGKTMAPIKDCTKQQCDIRELAEYTKSVLGDAPTKEPSPKQKSTEITKKGPAVDRSGAQKVKWLKEPLPKEGEDVSIGACAAEICRQFKMLCPVDCFAIARHFKDADFSQSEFNNICRKLPDKLPLERTDDVGKCEDAGGVVVDKVDYK